MPRSRAVPSYRLHKPSSQAVVTIRATTGERRDVYLGTYDSPDSRREYARIVAELASGTAPAAAPRADGPGLTVNEMLLAYWEQHVERHYRTPDGKPTGEVDEIRRSVAPLRKLYGHTPAAEFGPKALAAVRREMVGARLCRGVVNQRVGRLKRVFRWATAEELIPATVDQALRALPGLQRGRTDAPEAEPVTPVDPMHVTAVLPHLSRHVRAVVELLQATGMRPAEACRLRLVEVDRANDAWVYRPTRHKTAHRGKERAVPLGPKARALLLAFVRGDHPPPDGFAHVELNNPDHRDARLVAADAYQEAGRDRDAELLRDLSRSLIWFGGCAIDPEAPVFSPVRERAERFKRLRAARKSKVQPSQLARRVKNPKRASSSEYHPHAYLNAVRKACKKAGVDHWHPNQLRHAHATEVRRLYGLEAAQAVLGHSRADVTQVYAERNLALAAKVAGEIG